ncbi:MAG: putative 26S proteasome regulatory subunit [Vezdaea aestivalis]|nr:MAG: putative 26S proteasome regulatory subunit [Vezdaea aestivalis]
MHPPKSNGTRATLTGDRVRSRDVVSEHISALRSLHNELVQLPSLKPSPTVNGLFTDLVNFCLPNLDASSVSKILSDPYIESLIPSFRELSSAAESELESYWARQITSCPNAEEARATLQLFPYINNFGSLVSLELHALLSTYYLSTPPTTIAFIGSGPLPLSSMCLATAFSNLKLTSTPPLITNMDRDPASIALSSALYARLQPPVPGAKNQRHVEFQCADAMDEMLDLTPYEVVYLAALVGADAAEKERIMESVASRMRTGTRLLVRSARGLRGLLYPVRDGMAGGKLEPLIELHPYGEVINSVIIFRVKP